MTADVLRERLCIDADHPSLPGHFPGRPLVPGVVVLEQVLRAVEAAMKQALRIAATQGNLKTDADFGALANLLRCYAVGRWEQYARSGFSREPLAQWPQQWPMLYFACQSQAGPAGD